MTNLRTVQPGVDGLVRIGKAIDHPLRVRALAALARRELCVCELVDLFSLAPSTVSKHMSVLADAGLVVRRRDGKWTYYSLPDTGGPVRDVLALVTTAAADDPDVVEDAARLTTLRCEGVING